MDYINSTVFRVEKYPRINYFENRICRIFYWIYDFQTYASNIYYININELYF